MQGIFIVFREFPVKNELAKANKKMKKYYISAVGKLSCFLLFIRVKVAK